MRPQADYLWTNWAVLYYYGCEIIEQREVSRGFITKPKLHSLSINGSNHAGLKHKSVYLVTSEMSCPPKHIPVILYLTNFHSCCAPIYHVLGIHITLKSVFVSMKGGRTCGALAFSTNKMSFDPEKNLSAN